MSLSVRVSGLVPLRWLGLGVRVVYPRVEPELTHLAEMVPGGGTAVDVGGWFGPWTQRLRGVADRVVTVEADPVMARLLEETFKDVRVVWGAASDREGEVELWVTENRVAGTSSVGRREGRPVTVPQVTIDGLGLADVRFVKLDIEGHELAALRGAEQTIKRDRPVLLLELEERHQSVTSVVELLAGWGYRGEVLLSRKWQSLEDFALVEHQATNIRRVTQSFLRRVLWPHPRYVNLVLFRPLDG